MKKTVLIIIALATVISSAVAMACVGKTITVGVSNSHNEKLLAEVVSTLITERTGTSVKVQVFKDSRELYAAIRQGQVNLLIENLDQAMDVLQKPREGQKASYDLIKNEYRKNLNLVWLEPFGGSQRYGSVLTPDTLTNYPALPKLLNKLAGVLNGDASSKLFKSPDADDKPKKAARDFLKARKLI